jgi:peptidyl-prolyl cis-trans isomerase SurA
MKTTARFCVVLMAVFSALSFSLLSQNVNAEVIERVIAVVNDMVVTESDVSNYRDTLKKGQLVDDLIVTNPAELMKNRELLIEQMINERIIDSEVKKQGLSITVERIEQEIRKITTKNNISRNQLKQALKEQGVSFSEYQDFIKKRLERQALIERAITSKIKISDEEIANFYYSNNTGSRQQAYEYKIAHILFRPKEGDVEGAQQRANKVFQLLKNGVPFEELAPKHSEEPEFTNGGLLGSFKSGEFSPEFEAAVKGLSAGDFSTVTKSKFGFHILKLLDRKVVTDPNLTKVENGIRAKLYEAAFKRQFAFWLDQKKRQSFVRVNK